MADTNDTQDDFRTGLEIIRDDDAEDSTRFCKTCSELAGQEVWTPHRMRDNGAYDCLQCLRRQVPADDQATPGDVAEAFADLGEGPK